MVALKQELNEQPQGLAIAVSDLTETVAEVVLRTGAHQARVKICLERPSGAGERLTISTNTNNHWSGSGRRRGVWAHLRGGSRKAALSGQGRPSRAGFRELEERSASAPQVRMRRESKTANSACECQVANERRARRQLISNCRARARVEMVIIWSRGQNAKTINNRSRSRYR
eukprot:6211904-Pleurochrysis_carterae.AAC.1